MMMDLAQLEHDYKILLRDFQTGKIDQTTFISKVDELQFRDHRGYHWMIGSETGAWYYYDGRNWQQADPQQADRLSFVDKQGRSWQQDVSSGDWYYYQPEVRRWLKQPKPPDTPRPSTEEPAAVPKAHLFGRRPGLPKIFLTAALALFTIMVLLILPLGGSPAAREPLQDTSPLPTPTETLPGGGVSGDGSQSAIFGTLLDLSTNQPGTGIEISVNGSIVRTDSDGSFSITGLSAGEYYVLPELGGQGTLTQGPRYISLDGRNDVTVELTYRSRSEPLPTDTPQPAAASVATPPERLPDSGAAMAVRPFIIGGIGLFLVIMGGLLHLGHTKTRR